MTANIDDGVLDLRRLVGRSWGGRFEASGQADAGRGRIDAELQSRGATIGAVRAGLNGRARLSLRPAARRGVDLAQTLRGWRSALATGSDSAASDATRQTEFSLLEGSFELRNGVAHNSDIDGRSEYPRVGGEGAIDLAQGRLDYLLRARVVNTASGRAGPEMVMLDGGTVSVELHGPFGNIEWQVGWGAVTAAVAALSVPNVARGTVARGATGVARGAAGLLRGAATPAASAPPR